MAKVYLGKTIDGDSYRYGLIMEGRMLVFSMGRYLGERPSTLNVGNIEEVDVISVLDEGEHMEVGLNIGGVFKAYSVEKQDAFLRALSDVLRAGILFRGERSVSFGNVKARQTFIVVSRGRIGKDYFKKAGCKDA